MSSLRRRAKRVFTARRSDSELPIAAPRIGASSAESESLAGYASRVAAEIATFENDEIVHNLPAIFHYWSNKYLLPKIQPFGFIHPDDFFIKQLAASIENSPAPWHHFVSVGAGNCDTEVRIAEGLLALGHDTFSMECLDLNATMLDRGQALARISNCAKHVIPVRADFNHWTPVKPYHAVIANQSLHHVVNLEGLFDAIAEAIRPTNGVLVTSDMIGRNGHQRWPEALAIIEEYWKTLDTRYKYNRQLRRTEETFVNWDCSTEGFEGIRAQDILPLLLDRFHFDLFVPFANIISPFIDRGFGPNFDINSVEDLRFIDELHARDEAEMIAGRIKPTQMFAVLSLDHSRVTRHVPGLTPSTCVRRVYGN